jgi:hypothetical protein
MQAGKDKIALRRIMSRLHIRFAGEVILVFILSSLLAACVSSPSPQKTVIPSVSTVLRPQVVATGWTAELIGKLTIVDGCVRVIDSKNVSYLLVWPLDINTTITKEHIDINTGAVTGHQKRIVLHDGDELRLSGGETPQPTLLPPLNCEGPYWMVGFEISPINQNIGKPTP